MKMYKVPAMITINEQEIDDIVDAAVNACNYWCSSLEYGKKPKGNTAMSEALSHGGTLVFKTDEPMGEDEATEFELTTEKMLEGLACYEQYDFEEFDGLMSDQAIQYALFGEVVYG